MNRDKVLDIAFKSGYGRQITNHKQHIWGGEFETRIVEQFAEAIVRECLQICKEHPARKDPIKWQSETVAPDIAYRIRRHFDITDEEVPR